MVSFADFDRYVEEHGIPEQEFRPRSRFGTRKPQAGRFPRLEEVESMEEHPLIEGDDLWPAALLPNLADST